MKGIADQRCFQILLTLRNASLKILDPMFGSNKPKKEESKNAKVSSPSSNALNSLVQGTFIEGKLKATNDIRIDGTIKGELFCDAKVIIGPSGVVEGTIKCQNAVIEGRFDGNLLVKELLNIRETANVTGEVSYGKLIVQSGAVISGSYKVAGEGGNGSFKSLGDKKNLTSGKSDAGSIAEKAHISNQ
ncbi:MAG: polymer-forming cytoskeletal protein [Saprospiraceae bacterium]